MIIAQTYTGSICTGVSELIIMQTYAESVCTSVSMPRAVYIKCISIT